MCASRPVATTLAPPPQPGSTPTSPPSSPPSLRHQSRTQFHARRCSPTRGRLTCQIIIVFLVHCSYGTLTLRPTGLRAVVPRHRSPRCGAAVALVDAAPSSAPLDEEWAAKRAEKRHLVGARLATLAVWDAHCRARTAPCTPVPHAPRTPRLRCSGPRSASFAPGAPASHLTASASQRTPRWGWRCASGTRCCATSARRFRRGAPSKSPSSPSSWRRSSAQTHVENNAGQRSPSCLAEAGSSSGQPKA